MKTCYKCKKEKEISEFYKCKREKDGHHPLCKKCCKEYREENKSKAKEYNKKYRKNNEKKLKEYKKEYYQNNKEQIKEKVLKYQKTKNGKKVKKKSNEKYRTTDKVIKIREIWINKNKKDLNKKKKIRYEKNKINHVISGAIRLSLNGKKNNRHWEDLVNFNLIDLKEHLKKLFKPGMSWENYGIYGWHIDHVRPLSSFKITDYNCEDFKKCWSLNNLQPLWAEENLKKGSKW